MMERINDVILLLLLLILLLLHLLLPRGGRGHVRVRALHGLLLGGSTWMLLPSRAAPAGTGTNSGSSRRRIKGRTPKVGRKGVAPKERILLIVVAMRLLLLLLLEIGMPRSTILPGSRSSSSTSSCSSCPTPNAVRVKSLDVATRQCRHPLAEGVAAVALVIVINATPPRLPRLRSIPQRRRRCCRSRTPTVITASVGTGRTVRCGTQSGSLPIRTGRGGQRRQFSRMIPRPLHALPRFCATTAATAGGWSAGAGG
mmetsp:Transcript_9819/g.21171  ORF Transcript_9819/g.21171 Transcript_9819/m.21171 type:complete len:256 (+) Transcript_9819:2560-3327(+)